MIINHNMSLEEKQKIFNTLKHKDWMEFLCTNCGKNYRTQKRKRAKYSIEKVFLCSKCLRERNVLDNYDSIENYENYRANKIKEAVSKRTKEQIDIINKKIKKTKLEKYGDENYNNFSKIKQTNLEKYGVEYNFQLEDFKQKTEEALIEKYGSVKNAYLERQKKTKQTNLKKYGVECNLQRECTKQKTKEKYLNDKIKVANAHKKTNETKRKKGNLNVYKKAMKTYKEKTGFSHPMKNPDVVSLNSSKYKVWRFNENIKNVKEFFSEELDVLNINGKFFLKCKKCGETWEFIDMKPRSLKCLKCFPKNAGISKQEKDVLNFVKSLGYSDDEILENSKLILNSYKNKELLNYSKKPIVKELDIYIPKEKLAIEYNGIYWHSEDKDGQLNKKKMCEVLGINLIHVNELDWLYKQDIVKSIINTKKEKIYARKCNVKKLTKQEEKCFFNKTHLKGYINSKECYGLIYNGEIVQAMSFGKSRYNKKYEWEILRESSALNKVIIGGCNKLLKKFETEMMPKSLISYCDYSIFNGNSYEKMGFKYVKLTPPNYKYLSKSRKELLSREKFQKHKLKNILEDFNENLTEVENMHNNGYLRFFDCGNKVFEKIYNKEVNVDN